MKGMEPVSRRGTPPVNHKAAPLVYFYKAVNFRKDKDGWSQNLNAYRVYVPNQVGELLLGLSHHVEN